MNLLTIKYKMCAELINPRCDIFIVTKHKYFIRILPISILCFNPANVIGRFQSFKLAKIAIEEDKHRVNKPKISEPLWID